MLDVDTGGGEWLASLPARADRTVATESWPPNLDVARERLAPLGIDVLRAEAVADNVVQREGEPALPCADASFDLVTARHAAYVAREIARVLVNGGVFLTEQVGGDYGGFYDALGLPPPATRRRFDLAFAVEQLAAAGLECVHSAEGEETTTFADVGALAWYLRQIPWTVEDFAVERHRPNLERVHERISRDGALRVHLPAFWLQAVKSA